MARRSLPLFPRAFSKEPPPPPPPWLMYRAAFYPGGAARSPGLAANLPAVRARKDFSRAFLFAREQPDDRSGIGTDGPRHPYRRAFLVPEINKSRASAPSSHAARPISYARVIARRFLSSRDFSPPLQHSPLQFIEFHGIGGRKGEGNGNVSNTPAIRYSGARSTVNGKFGGKEGRGGRGGLFLSIDRISGCQSCRVL